MKGVMILLVILALTFPVGAFAAQSVITERVQFSIEEDGSWFLADLEAGIFWQGTWITPELMKVSGTDDTCYLLAEKGENMLQFGCPDLTQLSILFSR